MEIYELTVHELLEKLEKKEITSQEIVESYLKRIDEKENDVQAFVTKAGEKTLDLVSEPSQCISSPISALYLSIVYLLSSLVFIS